MPINQRGEKREKENDGCGREKELLLHKKGV